MIAAAGSVNVVSEGTCNMSSTTEERQFMHVSRVYEKMLYFCAVDLLVDFLYKQNCRPTIFHKKIPTDVARMNTSNSIGNQRFTKRKQ